MIWFQEAIAINTNAIMSFIYVIVFEKRDTWKIISLQLKLYDYENIWKKYNNLNL